MQKRCNKCTEVKPLFDFNKDKSSGSGYQTYCRVCQIEHKTNKRRKNGIKERKLSKIEKGLKQCLDCNTWKTFDKYISTKTGIGGLYSYCRDCTKKRYNKLSFRYRDKKREWGQKAVLINPKFIRDRYIRNYEKTNKVTVENDGTVTNDVLLDLLQIKDCYYCGEETEYRQRTTDHKVPLKRGGTHSAGNLVMACRSCNSSKNDLTEDEYYKINNGFHKNKRSKVSSKNILTGEIINFPNTCRCAAYFGLSRTKLLTHLKSTNYGRYTKNWCVFKFTHDYDWPTLDQSELLENSFDEFVGRCCGIKVEEYTDNPKDTAKIGTIVFGESREKLTESLGLIPKLVKDQVSRKGYKIPYKGWIFLTRDNVTGKEIKKYVK